LEHIRELNLNNKTKRSQQCKTFKLKLLKEAKEYYENEGFNILGFFGSYARGEATLGFAV